MAERLQKVIAQAGIASRRKAEQLIIDGRVTVNGKVVTELGTKVSKKDVIEVDGAKIEKENKVYYLFNKPGKTLCTTYDDRKRATVLDYFENIGERIFPVGRLDYDTTGILLLTNDGEFANALMHPSKHIPKEYEVAINGYLSEDEIKQLKKGIKLDDGMTLPAYVNVISYNEHKDKTIFTIVIYEGRNREIKRMMEYFQHRVTRLERKKYAFLDCGNLKRGQYRQLKKFEIDELLELANTK